MTTRRLVTLVLCFVMLTFYPPSVIATEVNEQPPEFVNIQTPQGNLYPEFINLSGQSSIPAAELVWSITTLGQVNTIIPINQELISSSTFTNFTFNNAVYDWELSIPSYGYNCTCVFSIKSLDSPEATESSIVIFVGQNSHYTVIDLDTNILPVSSNDVKYLQYNILQPEDASTGNVGIVNDISFMANICQFSGNSCISETRNVFLNHSIQADGFYEIEINKLGLNLADGIWNFEIYLRDQYLRLSNPDYQQLTFDTNPPIVNISGVEYIDEMGTAVFSVSVDDGYDSSLVSLTWTVTEPNGLIRGISNGEFISDNSIQLLFNESGTWTISVLATDSVGYYAKENYSIIAENLPPVIVVENSDNYVLSEGKFSIDLDEPWFINASQTTDTASDLAELSFAWFADKELVHEDNNLSHDIINSVGTHAIMLEVTDNNGASSKLFFNLTIVDNDDSESINEFVFPLVSLILLGVGSIYLLVRLRKTDSKFNLPKWNK